MTRGIGSVSPQKNLRPNTRERSAVYRSLRENSMANGYVKNGSTNGYKAESFTSKASHSRRSRHYSPGKYRELSDEDEETIDRVTRKHNFVSRKSDFAGEDNENDSTNEPSERSKKRRLRYEEEAVESPKKEENNAPSPPIRHKRARIVSDENSADIVDEHPTKSPRSIRQEKRLKEVNNVDVDRSTEEMDEEDTTEEEENGGTSRPYPFRQRRAVVERFVATNSRMRDDRPRRNKITNKRFRLRERKQRKASVSQSEFKRRTCRYDSSSTGDDDDCQIPQSRKEDERFERRKEMSMVKARGRFQPINIGEADMNDPLIQQRERLRQTGASCADVDPMSIDKSIKFDQVGGLGPHIQSLKEVVLFPLLYPEVFSQFNIQAPKGVIFYGPPGTGKTLVARALANECSTGNKKVAFFMRKGADCLSKWVGESERQLRILFDEAYTMRPSIIFFDEIDGLAPVRSSRQDQIHSSIVSTLLALMDGLDSRGEVIVIGATNRLDSIDPALRRPGRFDRELRFSLPDLHARKQIIDIHTSRWGECKPSTEIVQWIAENASGYCGADLKYLCTETVLLAMRQRYPHIYMSTDKLNIDLKEIKITTEHLKSAMERITPASRRDLTIPSRPLDERTGTLLNKSVDFFLKSRVPEGYRCSQSVQSISTNELEKVVRALEPSPPLHPVRLLVCGNEKCSDAGQTSFIIPAMLSKLDHLPVYSLAINRIYIDGNPEKTLADTIQSAMRSAEKGPCILLLPSFDQWIKCVPQSVYLMLSSSLAQITGFTPILLLATVDSHFDDCPEEVFAVFSGSNSVQVGTIPRGLRNLYFERIFSNALVPPKVFDASKYICPGMATKENQPIRKLSDTEAKGLEKSYCNLLRELRIFLREQLGRLIRDRRFTAFAEPVDVEDAEDYYEVIKQPMSFADMMEKVDEKEYNHPDQFLADINLIISNAIEYNPADCMNGRTLRHNANSLRDIVEGCFDKEFDENFVEELERVAQLLKDSNIEPKFDKLLELPEGYNRQTKWNVSLSFENAKETTKANHRLHNSSKKKSANQSPADSRKKKSAAILNSLKLSLGEAECSNLSNGDMTSEKSKPVDADGSTAGASQSMTPSSVEMNLVIDEIALKELTNKTVVKTENWGAPQLERLAAELSHTISGFSAKWDRTELPAAITNLLSTWDFEFETSS